MKITFDLMYCVCGNNSSYYILNELGHVCIVKCMKCGVQVTGAHLEEVVIKWNRLQMMITHNCRLYRAGAQQVPKLFN